ncbi:MAG: EAL domain-containing protein [Rhodospirillales bacterium]|nr:EAL domain-containing protein [Rhodospirillales bacterium]
MSAKAGTMGMGEDGAQQHRLKRASLDHLQRALPVVLATNALNAVIIVLIFRESVPRPLIAGWCGALGGVLVLRAVLWIAYRRAREDGSPAENWAIWHVLGSGASGVVWGIAGAMFSLPGNNDFVVLGFVLGGLGAGALTALTHYVWAFYAFLIPSVLPFTIRLALEGSVHAEAMALMCVAYTASLAYLGWRAHCWAIQSLQLVHENQTLVRSLKNRIAEESEALRQTSERLSLDIAERSRAEAALADIGGRQTALAEFGERILSGASIDLLFNEAVCLVNNKLAMAGTAVLQLSEDVQSLFVRAAAGWASDIPPQSWIPTGLESPSGSALLLRAPIISGDLSCEQRFTVPAVYGNAGVVSLACVVIAGSPRPFGILEATDILKRSLGEEDITFLQSVANLLAVAVDRRCAEQSIQRLAFEDPLTGLPNRKVFRHRLQNCLARLSISRGLLAVMLLDLDHFKDVNDTLGHPTGDRLLAAVAHRLRTAGCADEPPARLGGDEFAMIINGLLKPDEAAAIAERIIRSIAEPFFVDGHEIRLGASIGITVSPNDSINPDHLLRYADLALYRAKEEGRSTYAFYAFAMAAEVESRKLLERDLRLAMTGEGLTLHYQPQIDLADGRITTAEALLRWHHKTRGILPPDAFIPVAETTGLVVPLGTWVLEHACRQAQAWEDNGLPPIIMAVNLSLSQCRRNNLIAAVEQLANRGFNLHHLEFEVTEQMFLPQETNACVDILRRLKQQGVMISIDDFGTGYSNLGRLRGLPVDKVKIDKSFVSGVGQQRDAEVIVRAMIALGSSLGLRVVAEGVETPEQLAFLRAEGCHAVQGFHLSAPLPPEEMEALLRCGTIWRRPLQPPSPPNSALERPKKNRTIRRTHESAT